jgi:two-component sensor histidine kinase
MSIRLAQQSTARVPTEGLLLVEEINHRLFDEYALASDSLRVEARRTVDRTARSVLTRAADRLWMAARAHQVLEPPATSGEVNLADYLERLCAALSFAKLRHRGIRLTILQDDIFLAAERCWQVGLILHELITDATRYGFDGRCGQILIEVTQDGPDVLYRVADDCDRVGSVTSSREHRLVEWLALHLQGHVSWNRLAGVAAAVLRFPYRTAA